MTHGHVGFTGTRGYVTETQRRLLHHALVLRRGPGATLHHGDCINADVFAHEYAMDLGYSVVVHPPSNPRYRAFLHGTVNLEPADYMVRNQAIVRASNVLIAVPETDEEVLRSGTWSTVRKARVKRIPIMLILPCGEKRWDTTKGLRL